MGDRLGWDDDLVDFDAVEEGGGKVVSRGRPKTALEELEDKCQRLKDENLHLKKHSNEQEDKIKRLATKLVRITQDIKKREAEGEQDLTRGPRRRDVETEEFIEDLKAQIRELTRQNEKYKNQVTYLKHVIETISAKKPGPYGGVQSRVDSGLTKKLVPLIGGRIGGKRPAQQRPKSSSPAPPSPISPPSPPPPAPLLFLDPAEMLAMLQASAANFDWTKVELDSLLRFGHFIAMKVTELETEVTNAKEDYRKFSSQLQETRHQLVLAQDKFKNTEDTFNMSMRAEHADVEQLRAELREKATSLAILQANQQFADTNHTAVKESHTKLVEQVELLNKALREERRRAIQIESELNAAQLSSATVKELNMIIEDLRRDKRVLQEEHNRLLQTVFGEGQNKELQFERERSLYRAKIQQLEQQISNFINENTKLIEQTKQTLQRLETYKSDSDQLRTEKKNLEIQFYEAQQQIELFQQKLKFFSGDTMADLKELEQALVYIKNKKMGLAPTLEETKLKREMEDLKLTNLELAHDIEKTQKLLSLQENIKSEYKHMVDTHRKEVDQMKKEYELQLCDQARLLDIKTDKIRKLEFQLNGVLYRKPVQDILYIEERIKELDQDLTDLAPDENALEIQVLGLLLNGSHVPQDVETFLSFDFYEHETVVTPVFSGLRISPDFVARMVIRIDDFFLNYLKVQNMPIELYRAYGFDFALLGCTMIPFRDLLLKSDKIITSKEIISTDDNITVIGTLQYSVRLVRSITEEVKLWKGRALAMSLAADDDSSERNNMYNGNELIIKIVECSLVFPPGKSNNAIPSPYVYHQFFEFPEQDTPIIDHTFNPSFNSSHTYPLQVTTELEEYLLTGTAEFYVFDDKDPEGDFCFGIASVPLKSLVRDKSIEGSYAIVDQNKNQNGTIQIEVFWRMPYKRPAVHGLPPRSVKDNHYNSSNNSDAYNTDKSDHEATPKSDRSDRARYVRSGSLTRQQENEGRAKRLGELAQKYHTQQFNQNTQNQNTQNQNTQNQNTQNQNQQNTSQERSEQKQQKIQKSVSATKPPRTQRGNSQQLTPRQHHPAVTEIMTDDDEVTPRPTRSQSSSNVPSPRTDTAQRTPRPNRITPPPLTNLPTNPSSPVITSPTQTNPISPHINNNNNNNSNNSNRRDKREEKSGTASRPSSAKRSARGGIAIYDNSIKPTNPRECIYVSIRRVDLHNNILEDASVDKIFSAFEFLRSNEQLETDVQPKQNNPFVFNFSREFKASEFQYKLFSILNSTRKSDADIIFDVCNEQANGDCVLIGTSEINLLDLIEFGKNLENEALDILDEHENKMSHGNAQEVTQVKQDHTNVLHTVDEKIKELEEKERHWAALEAAMEENIAHAAEQITLNIGGQLFATSKSTLLSFKGSFFDAMLASGRWKPDSKGRYFIDRDPTLFPVILNYLRTGKVHLSRYPYDVTEELKDELDFYLIDIPELTKQAPSNSSKLNSQIDKLKEWTGASSLIPIYVASRDGFGADVFHVKCDAKGPTIVLFKSSSGHRFGGYAALSWDSSNSSKHAPGSFLFTLSNPHHIPPTKYPLATGGVSHTMLCAATRGPSFGGGQDLCIVNNSNTQNCRSSFPFSFVDTTHKGDITFTGTQTFTLEEIEVYQVK